MYKSLQQYIKDKDTAAATYVQHTLAQCSTMFEWRGLPDTIPAQCLERALMTTGHCVIASVGGSLYALTGDKGGELDEYYRPTLYTVANPALNLNESYVIGSNCALLDNDYNGNSLMPIIGRYAVLLTDGVISLNTASILSRITVLIAASDEQTRASAEAYLSKIMDGDMSVIAESAFLKGVTMQTAGTQSSGYINQLIELVQYYQATLYNTLGLNANYNLKRERLNESEVNLNEDALLPYVQSMLTARIRGAGKANELFGTNITVELSGRWRARQEEQEDSEQQEDGGGGDTPDVPRGTEESEQHDDSSNQDNQDNQQENKDDISGNSEQ